MLNLILKNRKKMILIILLALLFLIGFWSYRATSEYKGYLDLEMNSDFSKLLETFQDTERVYKEVLNTKYLSETSRVELLVNNQRISNTWVRYREMAVYFNLEDESFIYAVSPQTALKITSYLGEEKVGRLSDKDESIISKLYELNSIWMNSIFLSKEPAYKYNFKDSLWRKELDNIEDETLIFLKSLDIKGLDELWLLRTEIK